ncbi:MAG: 4Fe-4S binding protein, partial [Zetaproteobacteria bacterium]
PSTHWIYAVLVAVMFLDLAVIRHLFCKYMCIYRVWQHMFKTRETLHVAYDTARASECAHCRYCEEACFLELDPKRTFEYDSCINCGECIAACEELHAKSRKYAPPGLLRFALGPDPRAQTDGRLRAASLRGRIKAALIGAAAGFALFAVGLAGYAPHQLIVDHAEAQAGMLSDYRVMVRHKLYRPARFELSVAGLDPRWWRLDATTLTLSTAGRAETRLHLSPAMPKGLHRIVVRAQADDGWSGEFVIMHYAGGGDGRAQGSHAGQNRVGKNP